MDKHRPEIPAETGTEKKVFGISATRITRILTGSFILIAVIHILVFTAIGLFTPAGWRLLWIFLFGLAVMLLVVLPLKRLRRKKARKAGEK